MGHPPTSAVHAEEDHNVRTEDEGEEPVIGGLSGPLAVGIDRRHLNSSLNRHIFLKLGLTTDTSPRKVGRDKNKCMCLIETVRYSLTNRALKMFRKKNERISIEHEIESEIERRET